MNRTSSAPQCGHPAAVRAFVLGSYVNANMLCVPRLPQNGESLLATSLFQEHGGKGLNLAVGLQRLGVEVELLMGVGADDAGAAVLRRLQDEGIDTHWVLAMGPHSGYGVGFIAPEGRNFLAIYPGANALLSADHVAQAQAALSRAQWALACFESPDPIILAMFRAARTQGVRTYLNPSPWRDADRDLLDLTDILVVNATEAALLFGAPELAELSRALWVERLPQLAEQLAWRGQLLVVTLGELGSVALDGRMVVREAAPWSVETVDATGAGDAFGCALVWSLAQGHAVPEALRLANAGGALLAARSGILDQLPRSAELLRFADAARQG